MMAVFALVFKRLWTQRLTLLVMIVFPFIIILIPQMTDGAPTGPFGLFGLVLMFSSFLISKQVIEDRQLRTVVRIAASPISHRDYLMGHLLGYALLVTVQVLVFTGLALMRYDVGFEFYRLALPLLWTFGLMTITLALFWHTFFKTFATSLSLFSVGANIMAVVSGMTFPLSLLPDRLKQIAVVLPTYWFAYGLENAQEQAVVTVLLSLAILTAFGIIFITIGSRRSYE